MRILVLGAYYSANLGDGVICECTAEILRRHFPDSEILIKDVFPRVDFSFPKGADMAELSRRRNRERLRRWVSAYLGWDKVLSHEQYRVDKSMAYIEKIAHIPCNLVVVAGGQLYMDRYELFLEAYIEYFSQRGIPVFLNACGAGPSYSRHIRQRFANALMNPCVKLISCRDNCEFISRNYRSADKSVMATFDPALWSHEVYRVQKDRLSDTVGLGMMYVRGMNIKKTAEFWVNLIRELEHRNIKWQVFINGDRDDLAMTEYVFSLIPEIKTSMEACCVAVPESPEGLIKMIAGFKSIISFRLHSHIIAAALDVPSVAVVWDGKLNFFFDKIGHPERCTTIRTKPDKILEILNNAETEGYNRLLIEEQRQYAANLLCEAIDKNLEQVQTI